MLEVNNRTSIRNYKKTVLTYNATTEFCYLCRYMPKDIFLVLNGYFMRKYIQCGVILHFMANCQIPFAYNHCDAAPVTKLYCLRYTQDSCGQKCVHSTYFTHTFNRTQFQYPGWKKWTEIHIALFDLIKNTFGCTIGVPT